MAGSGAAVSSVGARGARVVSAAAALAANALTASAGTVSFSTRGNRRAQALRDARGARNWKMVMIESPSDALHAASTGRTDIGDEWNGNSASGALGRGARVRARIAVGARRDGRRRGGGNGNDGNGSECCGGRPADRGAVREEAAVAACIEMQRMIVHAARTRRRMRPMLRTADDRVGRGRLRDAPLRHQRRRDRKPDREHAKPGGQVTMSVQHARQRVSGM